MPSITAVLTVGMKGRFQLITPFQTSTVIYTIQALRTINEWLDSDQDPLASVYLKNQLTQSDFNTAISANQLIASLQSEVGQWLYVPTNYIIGSPSADGVIYTANVLGVSIGSHAVTTNLTAVTQDISEVVYKHLGIRPVIKEVVVSKEQLLTQEEHQALITARNSRITDQYSIALKYRQLQITNQHLQSKLTELENFIIGHLGEM
jgi:hypothetical protein